MHMKDAFFFNIVVSNSPAVLQLFPIEQNNEVLWMNRRVSLLGLDLVLHVSNRVLALNVERDRSAGNLHTTKSTSAHAGPSEFREGARA
eukprot:CAMPEP_0172200030 /NCGR_PEP_ID=MMETSP1050-20130122/29053_1 /TAXON_ID=233186 /ORGANISM="Cryptomonas curvata, Strain CCAP979/52" /LENGTH=88 /DNA_ID=CAMNT_0012877191 /DNA_START=252 /DNA_END=514 /DNA_ORIENTATION=+